jgi:hypothetical protein
MTTIPGDLPQDANRTKSKKKPWNSQIERPEKSKKKRRKKRE